MFLVELESCRSKNEEKKLVSHLDTAELLGNLSCGRETSTQAWEAMGGPSTVPSAPELVSIAGSRRPTPSIQMLAGQGLKLSWHKRSVAVPAWPTRNSARTCGWSHLSPLASRTQAPRGRLRRLQLLQMIALQNSCPMPNLMLHRFCDLRVLSLLS